MRKLCDQLLLIYSSGVDKDFLLSGENNFYFNNNSRGKRMS